MFGVWGHSMSFPSTPHSRAMKDVYASGYRTLAAGVTSSGGAPPVFAEGVQQALYRWIAAEACR